MGMTLRRCPDCHGWWIRTLGGYEHNVGCVRKPEGGWLKEARTAPDLGGEPPARSEYPEDEQQRDAAALRGIGPVISSYHPPECPCEDCEDERRAALVKAYPELRAVGLSPKAEELDL